MLRKRTVLGELEIRVLTVLWERGASTVAEVADGLPPEGRRHYNTVATVLRRLSDRELVQKEKRGRSFVFTAAVSREELARHYLGIVREELYGGSWARLAAALLTPGRHAGRVESEVAKLLERLEGSEGDDGC